MFNMMMYTNDFLHNSICQQQPLHRLMHSKGCSLILSASLLGVGITITVMSLRSFSSTNKIFLVGPILMTVGILGMSRFLMQYLKKGSSQHQHQGGQVVSANNWQNPQIHTDTDMTECHGTNILALPISTLCHGTVQREDSETAIYLGPTDSEEGTYSDDPPPYDSVAVNTGTTVTSRVQLDNSISSSLPSLPPYDEGLINPALDLTTETFPAPPPYEVVAVQPPCYSTGTDVIERPVTAIHQLVRGSKRRTLDPTRRTVREVAQRLAQTMQAEHALAVQTAAQPEAVQVPGNSQEQTVLNHLESSPILTGVHVSQVTDNPCTMNDADVIQITGVMTNYQTSGMNDHLGLSLTDDSEESEIRSDAHLNVSSTSEPRSRVIDPSDLVDASHLSGVKSDMEASEISTCEPSVRIASDMDNHDDCVQDDLSDISALPLDSQNDYDNRTSGEVLPSSDISPGHSRVQHWTQPNVYVIKNEAEGESPAESRQPACDSASTASGNNITGDQSTEMKTA